MFQGRFPELQYNIHHFAVQAFESSQVTVYLSTDNEQSYQAYVRYRNYADSLTARKMPVPCPEFFTSNRQHNPMAFSQFLVQTSRPALLYIYVLDLLNALPAFKDHCENGTVC